MDDILKEERLRDWQTRELRCVLFKRGYKFPSLNNIPLHTLSWIKEDWFCGYVLVPKEHALFGKSTQELNDMDIAVHGGVTWAFHPHFEDKDSAMWAIGWDSHHGTEFSIASAIFETELLAVYIKLLGEKE